MFGWFRSKRTFADTGSGQLVDLLPWTHEALALRPGIARSLAGRIATALATHFNDGRPERRLVELGLSADDARFVYSRVMKWAFYERDCRSRAGAQNRKHRMFEGLRLTTDADHRCALATELTDRLFDFDDPPRLPVRSCDQEYCQCWLEPVMTAGKRKRTRIPLLSGREVGRRDRRR